MAKKKVKFDVNPLLSGPSMASRTTGGSPYRLLSLSEIDLDPDQPRRLFNEDSLAELATSISEFGVLSPIMVRLAEGGTYKLVAGERRYRASKIAGLKTIPALVVPEEDDGRTLVRQLTENIQREDLTPMERALAIGQLKESFALSVRDIAKQLGISKSMVQRSLEVLALPDDLQAALIAGASESKILLLAQLDDRDSRSALVGQLDDFTRAQLEEKIKEIQGGELELSHRGTAKTKKPSDKKPSPADERIMRDIQEQLGTRVQIVRKSSNPGQGKITLEFYSNQDLDEICQRLLAD